jgi:hypothetical protein
MNTWVNTPTAVISSLPWSSTATERSRSFSAAKASLGVRRFSAESEVRQRHFSESDEHRAAYSPRALDTRKREHGAWSLRKRRCLKMSAGKSPSPSCLHACNPNFRRAHMAEFLGNYKQCVCLDYGYDAKARRTLGP